MIFSPICLSLPAVLFQSASDRRLFPVRCTKFILSNPQNTFYATLVTNIRYLAVYAILCYTDLYKIKNFIYGFSSGEIVLHFHTNVVHPTVMLQHNRCQKLSTCFWEQTAFCWCP